MKRSVIETRRNAFGDSDHSETRVHAIECGGKFRKIGADSFTTKVDILRKLRGAVQQRSGTANQDEVNLRVSE